MGTWKLVSVKSDIRDRNDVFGNFFAVTFYLKYEPSRFGSFAEIPLLEWGETITMIERNKGTYWQYFGDQYARNPNSMTFLTWVNRYMNAYYCARQSLYGADETVRIYDKYRQPLKRDTIERAETPGGKADAIRSYLKRNGGFVDLTVVDKPGINKPRGDATVHKERILTFDCGLKGFKQRVKAYQHLVVDSAAPEAQWKRKMKLATVSPPLMTAGMTKTNPPADVSVIKKFTGKADQGQYQ